MNGYEYKQQLMLIALSLHLWFCSYALAFDRELRLWNPKLLSDPDRPLSQISIQTLINTGVLLQEDWGCLRNTDQPHHSVNRWEPFLPVSPSMLQNGSRILLSSIHESISARKKLSFHSRRKHHSEPVHFSSISRENAISDPDFLHGTTLWINEHMAVGHAMYDIALLQVYSMGFTLP